MKIFATDFVLRTSAGVPVSPRPRLEMSLEEDGAKLVMHASGVPEIEDPLEFAVAQLDGSLPDLPNAVAELTEVITLRVTDPGARARFATGICGLRLGVESTLRDVRLVLRPRAKDGWWSLAAPFLTIELCWDLAVKADGEVTPISGAKLEGEATASFPVCTSLVIVSPPECYVGLPDIFVGFDIEAFTLFTGWIPLDLIDVSDWIPDAPDVDWNDLLDMRGLAAWFLGLWRIDLPNYDLALPDWDIDFPKLPKLPFDARFKEQSLRLSKVDDTWQLACALKGITLDIGGIALTYDAFELSLRVNSDGDYVVKAGIARLQYPDPAKPDETAPRRIALPFGLLEAEAACWLLQFGLHLTGSTATGTARFCVDTILEIGGLEVRSTLSDDPLWSGDLRVHLRDLTAMTVAYGAGAPLFLAEATPVPSAEEDIFGPYRHPMPAMSFAEDLPRQAPSVVNENGLTVLASDFRAGERLYLAWEQKGNQLLKALAHDLLGGEAAGAIPADAETLRVGLEISTEDLQGARATQIRLDWTKRDGTNIELPKPPDEVDATETDDNCVDPATLLSGVHLPFGKPGVNLTDLTVPTPMALQLPGLRLHVARPSVHSLVLRQEADETRSASYLLVWEAAHAPAIPMALASAEVGFSLSGTDERAPRQVADPKPQAGQEGTPFLVAALGQATARAQALRVFGVQHRDKRFDRPKFLKVYDPPDGQPLVSLIPASLPAVGVDDCPPPPQPLPPQVALSFDDFDSPDLLDPDGPWRLSLKLGAQVALMDLFGGDNQNVAFKITKLCRAEDGTLEIHTQLNFDLAGDFSLDGTVVFGFDLEDLSLSVLDGAGLALRYPVTAGSPPAWAKSIGLSGKTTDYDYVTGLPDLFGLEMNAIRRKTKDADPELTLLEADISDGRFTLKTPEDTELLLRIQDVGDDGLNFRVRRFLVGPGGLDCTAEMLPTTFKVPGLNKPFALDYAKLVITNNRLQTIRVDGSGQMPDLFNNAPVSIGFSVWQDPQSRRISLRDFTCELGGGKAPIFSRGVRLKFDLDKVKLHYEDADGTRPATFQFRVTGSLTFVPEADEFAGSMLENFKDMTLSFSDAPVSDEFFDHVELMVSLKEPVERELFKIFRVQLRSVGFHPNFEFSPGKSSPALIFGGQIEFADTGDVASVEIDFHRIYLGFPAEGETLPQVSAKGLRVEISVDGFKVGGRLDSFDDDTITGFKGEGVVQIPGLPELSAAFAFTRIRKSPQDSWKRAWFIAVEGSKISYQIAPLPIYLRQIGLGFGYRYTSPLIRTFEEEVDLATLIENMLEAVRAHQTLARIESWVEDPDDQGRGPRWSIGFETVFSMASANSDPLTYNKKTEKKLKSAVAQILAFLRSDLTFVAAAKVWFPVSADDFFENTEGMRQRPLASGFMGYSAPKQRLLIHAASGKNPYLGPDNDPVPKELKPALEKVHFEATFLSEPGLVHAELGWPDRLLFPLDYGPLRMECRGGVLFRLERDTLIMGYYFSATSTLSFSGGLNAGCIGVCVTATARYSAAVRLMSALFLSRPLQSHVYAALGIDISVRFSLRAWLHIKFRFFTLRLSISFSFDLQIIVALELGWAGGAKFGFKAQARVVVSVFGRSLGVRVAAQVFGSNVDAARRRLQPYMSSFLEPGAVPPVPGVILEDGRRDGLRAVAPANLAGTGRREPLALPLERPVPMPNLTLGEMAAARLTPLSSRDAGAPVAPPPVAPQAVPQPIVPPAGPLEDASPRVTSEDRPFNLALGEGQSGRRWYGWIMPNVMTASFFPVPRQTGAYAQLVLPPLAPGTRVYTLNEEGKWSAAGGATRQLYIRPGPVIEAEELEGSADAAEAPTMDLRDLLASSHVPLDPKNDEDLPFDFGDGFDLYAPVPPLFDAGDVVEDKRLSDAQSEARNPKRALDPENAYDALVMKAMEDTPDEAFWKDQGRDPMGVNAMTDQALGNQSLLTSGFMEDLKSLAAEDLVSVGPASGAGLPKDRPTLMDLGLVICVEADTCPDWLCTRLGDPTTPGPRPTIAFVDGDNTETAHNVYQPGTDLLFPYAEATALWPAIDFRVADFEAFSPRLTQVVSFFDDDSLNVGWTLVWPGQAPAADLPGGSLRDPEDLLDHYDIAVFVTGERDPVRTTRAVPGDLLALDEIEGAKRVKTRYQFNLMLEDIPQLRATSLSLRTKVTVNITPIAQTGKPGRTKAIDVMHETSVSPLPADDAHLDLSFDASGALAGKLSWRVLTPPTAPGVGPAARWELILRPLRALPLGAYPADAVETSEAGLMNLGAGQIRPGDIIIALDLNSTEDFERHPPDSASATDRDPALEIIALKLLQTRTTLAEIRTLGHVFNHRGEQVDFGTDTDAPTGLAAIVLNFFSKIAPHDQDGRGWRLFLRAHSQSLQETTQLPKTGYSGIVPVTLRMTRSDGAIATPERLLDHLEWVRPSTTPEVLPTDALREDHGPLLRPGFVGPAPDDDPRRAPDWEVAPDAEVVDYSQNDMLERGVTLRWKAVWGTRPYAATAQFELFEARFDHLLAQDIDSDAAGAIDPHPEFAADWKPIRHVAPMDQAFVARAVTAFTKPETWWSSTPAEAAMRSWEAHCRHLIHKTARREDTFSVPDEARQPLSWWSWSESELAWPELHSTLVTKLDDLAAESDVAPIETIRAIIVGQEAPSAESDAHYLAACRDLGAYLCGSKVHAALAMVVGQLAVQGAPAAQSGLQGEDVLSRFEVEAQVGAASGEPTKEQAQAKPLDWLFGLGEAVDPRGWTILAELGLAVTLSLRDGITRMSLPQSRLRAELSQAITVVAARLARAEIPGKEATPPTPLTPLRHTLARHLGVDLPIHPSAAITARAGRRSVDDTPLSMLQVSLRPVPVEGQGPRKVVYETFALSKDRVPTEIKAAPPTDMELLLPDRQNTRVLLKKGQATDLSNFLSPGDVVFARYTALDGEQDLLKTLLSEYNAYDKERVEGSLRGRDVLPLPFVPTEEAATYTPYRRFPAKSILSPETMAEAFKGLVAVLAQKFRPADPEQAEEFDADLAVAVLAAVEDQRLFAATARFFDTAIPAGLALDKTNPTLGLPLPDRRVPDAVAAPFHPLRTTLTAPEEQDPLALSPDRQGWMSYTHRVKEDWASLRGYAVRAVPRDWALNPESRVPAKIKLSASTGCIDVRFSRIRKVEPPKPLAIRTAGSADYPLHEVVLSEPVERSLSRAGHPFADKLEYQDTRFTPHTEFRYALWREKLKGAELISDPLDYALDRDDDPNSTRGGPLPERISDDTQLLRDVPAARFGANILRFAAEPFYFDQRMHLTVRAGERQSEFTSVTLAPVSPQAPHPLEDIADLAAPGTVTRDPALTWDALEGGDRALPPGLAAVKARWDHAVTVTHAPTEDAAEEEGLDPLIIAEAQPYGDLYTLRFPQLAEGLSTAARTGHLSAEVLPKAAGRLPDPNMRLELAQVTAGARKTVAMMTGRQDMDDACFKQVATSLDHAVSPVTVSVAEDGWDAGILLSTTVTPAPAPTPIDLDGLTPGAFNVPQLPASSDDPDTPQTLRVPGDLARWLPLTIGLEARAGGGAYWGVLPTQKWALNPVHYFPTTRRPDLDIEDRPIWDIFRRHTEPSTSALALIGALEGTGIASRGTAVSPLEDWSAPPQIVEVEDVTTAFSILLSVQHRLGMELAAKKVEDSPNRWALLERSYMARIHDAEFVVVTPKTNAVVDALDDLYNAHGDAYSLLVYKAFGTQEDRFPWQEVGPDGDSAGTIAARPWFRPVPIDGSLQRFDAVDDRIVVIVPKLADVTGDALVSLMETLALLKATYPADYPFDDTMGDPAVDFASLRQLQALSERLATELMAKERPAPLEVFAQSGNLGPILWPTTVLASSEEEEGQ